MSGTLTEAKYTEHSSVFYCMSGYRNFSICCFKYCYNEYATVQVEVFSVGSPCSVLVYQGYGRHCCLPSSGWRWRQ